MPMQLPVFDTDDISIEEKARAQFQFVYQGMLAELKRPGFVSVLCAHEAAHLFYFALLGATEYEALPPRIRRDPATGGYVGDMAGVQLLKPPSTWQPGKFHEWLQLLACAHAAGGVVARKLRPSEDGGDAEDHDRFRRLCDRLNEDPNVSINFKELWEWAQVSVEQALNQQEVTRFIEEQGAVLKREFGFDDA